MFTAEWPTWTAAVAITERSPGLQVNCFGRSIMDLELLVIGATTAGWHVATAAAQAGTRVGLVALPSPHCDGIDLHQFSDDLLSDVCADFPLLRPLRETRAPRGNSNWRQFAEIALDAWRREQFAYRDRLFARHGLIWTGGAEFQDAHTINIDESAHHPVQVNARHVVLATGSHAVRPRFAPPRFPGVHDAAALLKADSIPQVACVVGGGLTGLRAACLLAWWGADVTVIDGQPSLDHLVDEQTAEWLNWGEELGVRFECGEDVIGLRSQAALRVDLTLESGRLLSAESVWLATGRHGATDLLQIERAGLSQDDRGRLWCDDQHRTWTESIYATGDVVGFCPTVLTERETAARIVNSIRGIVRSPRLIVSEYWPVEQSRSSAVA